MTNYRVTPRARDDLKVLAVIPNKNGVGCSATNISNSLNSGLSGLRKILCWAEIDLMSAKVFIHFLKQSMLCFIDSGRK